MLQDAVWADTSKLQSDQAYQDTTGQVPHRGAEGLGVLPGQPGEVPGHRGRPRVQARQEPPALADERDQPADLASTSKIGLVDQAAWNQTVDIAQKTRTPRARPC
jgi:NitT/TauT family transport system substrate-binding protein